MQAAAVAAALTFTVGTQATVVTLEDGNATTVFETDLAGGNNGQLLWSVGSDTDHVVRQWFFIRVNNAGHALNGREFKWDPLESTCRHASLSIL